MQGKAICSPEGTACRGSSPSPAPQAQSQLALGRPEAGSGKRPSLPRPALVPALRPAAFSTNVLSRHGRPRVVASGVSLALSPGPRRGGLASRGPPSREARQLLSTCQCGERVSLSGERVVGVARLPRSPRRCRETVPPAPLSGVSVAPAGPTSPRVRAPDPAWVSQWDAETHGTYSCQAPSRRRINVLSETNNEP